jgi:hypothetical protein
VYLSDGNLVRYGPAGPVGPNTDGQPVGVTILQAEGTW